MKPAFTIQKTIFHLTAWLLCVTANIIPAHGQQSVYIPSGGRIFSHSADTVGIFGDVINEGSFGSGEHAVVNFYGKEWDNDPSAQLPGENGKGGTFRFLYSAVYNNGRQYLSGGYNAGMATGASFPNLSIENKKGVALKDLSDVNIRDTLHLLDGHLFLNGWNAVIGGDAPGNISGYSENSFIVTGTDPVGGYVYRAPDPRQDKTVFPIGTSESSYTPAAISGNGIQGNYRARVFDEVYEYAVSGNRDTGYAVEKTWNIGNTSTVMPGDATVILQHSLDDEGRYFTLLRDSSYVSRYANTQWDQSDEYGFTTPGSLTTGTPIRDTYLNQRTFTGVPGENDYFSVRINPVSGCITPTVKFQLFAAQRYSARWVQLFWRTTAERNIRLFELQRRRESDTAFTTIEVQATQFIPGRGGIFYYYSKDDNPTDEPSYYRLKMTGYDDCTSYTSILKVLPFIHIRVWPNPNDGHFQVEVSESRDKIYMNVVDVPGRVLYTHSLTNGVTGFNLSYLARGTYFLVFYKEGEKGKPFYSFKMELVAPYE